MNSKVFAVAAEAKAARAIGSKATYLPTETYLTTEENELVVQHFAWFEFVKTADIAWCGTAWFVVPDRYEVPDFRFKSFSPTKLEPRWMPFDGPLRP